MENVADALYMATAVLILLVALAVGVSSLTNIKDQVQQLVNTEETVDMSKDETDNYINYIKASGANRVVGVETVISTIRKIKNESYVVYIRFDTSDSVLNYLYSANGYREIATRGETYKKLTEDNLENLYNAIKEKPFNEYIGIYRIKKENVSDENNPEHRIIIYDES